MAELTSAAISNLPDAAFAFIESGGSRDPSGRTAPRSKRHFPIHDEAAVRTSLTQAPQSPFGKEAMPAILTAARKFGVKTSGADRAFAHPNPVSGFPERRFTKFPLELRQDPGAAKHIWGYAACYNKLSRKLGGFVEQVSDTAFNESRTEGWPDVVCRYNHKDDYLLGTTHARTLEIGSDATGLWYNVEPPQSRTDILEYVQRGDIRHSSFAFRTFPGGDEWAVTDFGYPLRTLLAVELIDVAPVLDPAYPDATAGARALDGAVESLAMWVQGDPEEVRSMLAENRGTEFFKRTDNAGPAKKNERAKPVPPKQMLFGPAAMLELMQNQEDPYADED